MSQFSVSGKSMRKGVEDHVNYKNMIKGQQKLASEKSQFGRIKPWESYKFQQQDNAGLLGLLNQQDIDSVGVVYFTQEDYREEGKSDIIDGDQTVK